MPTKDMNTKNRIRSIQYLLYKQYMREAGGQPYFKFETWLKKNVGLQFEDSEMESTVELPSSKKLKSNLQKQLA